jgi:phosphoribosylaminoimidazole-succinocarboxamide synthase
MNQAALMNTDFGNLKLLNRGKVRDIYDVDPYLLIVTTDRISAFDVVMPNPIPGKGKVLNSMSIFWFDRMKDIIANHLVSSEPKDYPESCVPYAAFLEGRSMLVKKARPLPVECIVRGFISGSGWKDYLKDQSICGIKLPAGLRESDKLPEPLFTPSTKAEVGKHDAPMTRTEMEILIGRELTEQIIRISLAIYKRAVQLADKVGIVIADTKMEFGVLNGELILIDELLTPDSSRFWPKDSYEPGKSQNSYDKQFLRDYLLSIKWDQKPPAPELPKDIIQKTGSKYSDALRLLVK